VSLPSEALVLIGCLLDVIQYSSDGVILLRLSNEWSSRLLVLSGPGLRDPVTVAASGPGWH
jgi:hypothetical protein